MTRAVLFAVVVLALLAAGRAQAARDHAEHVSGPALFGRIAASCGAICVDSALDGRAPRSLRRRAPRRDRRALRAVEQDVSRTLAHEEHEARLEVMQARGELQHARGEVTAERRGAYDARRPARRSRRSARPARRPPRSARRSARGARRVAAIRNDFSRVCRGGWITAPWTEARDAHGAEPRMAAELREDPRD